jgi:hypothetical protein
MGRRTAIALLVALVATSALAASAGGALVGIYRNSMESDSQRGEMKHLLGNRCARGGSDHAFRISIGKRTRECAYATPVVGRDLEITAVGRLLKSTPKGLQRKAFLSLSLRTGSAGAGYQLVVFPMQRKAQLRKNLSDGRIRYLGIERNVPSVKGLGRANELRLRAFNATSGPNKGESRIRALVGRRLIADVRDDAAGDLEGRASSFSVGATKSAKGAAASFDDVVLRVPSPF